MELNGCVVDQHRLGEGSCTYCVERESIHWMAPTSEELGIQTTDYQVGVGALQENQPNVTRFYDYNRA